MATPLWRSSRLFRAAVRICRGTSTVVPVPAALEEAVVLGVYNEENSSENVLTPRAQAYDKDGNIAALLKLGGPLRAGETRVLWGCGGGAVAVAGLGARTPLPQSHEQLDAAAELVRRAAAVGVRALMSLGARRVLTDDMCYARAAAEGATLAAYRFQQFRHEPKPVPDIAPLAPEEDPVGWRIGASGSESQNWARTLMERPGNTLTPAMLAEEFCQKLQPLGVRVVVRDREWVEQQRMGCFLSVARGSEEPPYFIEMHYTGHPDTKHPPLALVGKGVTFDSGGVSLKPGAKMADMRGDMGGAAVVGAALHAAATLRLPVNIVALVPSTENMPDGRATKPGDVFTARNGKSVLVDNTDAEGRLILADALCYAHEFSPLVTLDLATLTGAIRVALGDCCAGLFTRHDDVAAALVAAAHTTGDRVWRMPLYNRYAERVTGYDYVDVHNMGKGKGGGACTAAGFLLQFAPERWAHLDIAGVMNDTEDQPYVSGMTGRPTRTILEFIRAHAHNPK